MLFKDIKIIDGNFQVRSGMYLRTEGSFITYIGEAMPEAKKDEELIDGHGKLLMPGLYNVHCHAPMTLLRGYGEGLELHRWLNEKIFPFEANLISSDVYWGTKLGALELMAAGCVSVSDMYFFIDDMANAFYECGMKANISHGISSFDPEARLKEMKGYKDTVALDRRVKAGDFGGAGGAGSMIKADMGLHAEYTTTESFVRQVAAAAAEEQLSIHVHVSETEYEHAGAKERHGGRSVVEYFRDCGVFDSKVLAAHCVYLDDGDIDIMREAGAAAVHNPSSNLKLGSGIAPIKKYMSRGLKVALGTDGPSSNNNLNMMEEMHLAAMLARGISRDANAVSASDIVRMASYEGALVQGRQDCGKLEEGYRADIVMIDLSSPHMQPDFDTLSNLVFSAGAGDVVMTVIDGKTVYKNGEYMFADRERIIYEANLSFLRCLNA